MLQVARRITLKVFESVVMICIVVYSDYCSQLLFYGKNLFEFTQQFNRWMNAFQNYKPEQRVNLKSFESIEMKFFSSFFFAHDFIFSLYVLNLLEKVMIFFLLKVIINNREWRNLLKKQNGEKNGETQKKTWNFLYQKNVHFCRDFCYFYSFLYGSHKWWERKTSLLNWNDRKKCKPLNTVL